MIHDLKVAACGAMALFEALNSPHLNPNALRLEGQLALLSPKYGHTTLEPGLYGRKFILHARNLVKYGKLLDIGAAVGVTTIPVARQGIPIIANDIVGQNLTVLKQQAGAAGDLITPAPGDFRKLEIPDNSLGGIMVGSVLHFFTPEEVRESLALFRRWLAPGGMLFIETQTPYILSKLGYTKQFIDVLEKMQQKEPKITFPCVLEDFKEMPKLSKFDRLNLFELYGLQSELERAGFIPLRVRYFPRKDYPEDLTGYGENRVGQSGIDGLRLQFEKCYQNGCLIPFESVGASAVKPRPGDTRKRDYEMNEGEGAGRFRIRRPR